MKNYILIFITLFTLASSQTTGMLTPLGNTKMGLWSHYSANVEEVDQNNADLSFQYMTTSGIEFILGLHYDGENQYKALSFGYHIKLQSINANVQWTRFKSDENQLISYDDMSLLIYSNKGIYGGFSGIKTETEDIVFEWLKVGKLWQFSDNINLGFYYSAKTNEADKGNLGLNMGFTFFSY